MGGWRLETGDWRGAEFNDEPEGVGVLRSKPVAPSLTVFEPLPECLALRSSIALVRCVFRLEWRGGVRGVVRLRLPDRR